MVVNDTHEDFAEYSHFDEKHALIAFDLAVPNGPLSRRIDFP
jgi:hypothetical protein